MINNPKPAKRPAWPFMYTFKKGRWYINKPARPAPVYKSVEPAPW